MKTKKSAVLVTFLLILSLGIMLTGCQESDGTIEEPDLTVQYLSGEYVDQIVRDGAETVTGSIKIKKSKDESLELKIRSKAVVKNESYEKGYYIADKNRSIAARIDSDTRATYIDEGAKEPKVVSIDDLEKAIQQEKNSKEPKLYDVYLMGDQALLILAKAL